MKQDKADKIIQKAERRAAKAAKQVEAAGKKAEVTRQKQEAQAQKKAAKAADSAAKKAAAKTKKAEAVAKKAQMAAKKAEEKKAKAMAKTAAKSGENEGEAAGGKGKKGKKKLLLIAIPVLALVIGAGVWFFFLRGGGEEEETPLEPIAAPVEYILNEAHITALPVWGDEVLVYQEEVTPEPPAEPEGEGEEGGEEAAAEPEAAFTKILYRYEGLQNPVSLISAYAALMSTEDAGFSVVDETLLRIDPPETLASQGSLQLARNLPKAEDGTGGGVQSLLLNWSGNNCSVTLDMPDGRVHDPKPETAAPAGPRWSLSDLESVHPSKLGLPGESMEDYTLIPQEGSVRIAGTGSVAMRVNIYGKDSQIAGIYFLANDGKLYRLDEATNAVSELKWE